MQWSRHNAELSEANHGAQIVRMTLGLPRFARIPYRQAPVLRHNYPRPDPDHLAILQQGVDAWNQWRAEHPK